MLSSTATEIQNQYNAGQRDFPNLQLRREDLHGLNLKNANLQGADFSYTNLRDVDLSGADLRDAYFNEADLTGANLENAILTNASLVKTYLIKANLTSADLQNAYLSGAYLTRGNLEKALLQGAYFNGTQLTGAKLTNAIYDDKTQFDHTVNIKKLGLILADQMKQEQSPQVSQKEENINTINGEVEEKSNGDISNVINHPAEVQVTIEALVKMLNHLMETGQRYLGKTMTVRYWKSSKPKTDWVNEFDIDESSNVTYIGVQNTPLSSEQLEDAREWIIAFVKACSMIMQNYTEMLDPKFLAFPIIPKNSGKKTAKVTSIRPPAASQPIQPTRLVAV
ncbi:MAG: pentapeptide repeat-containing protein [Microcystaceae cyanobacterium]